MEYINNNNVYLSSLIVFMYDVYTGLSYVCTGQLYSETISTENITCCDYFFTLITLSWVSCVCEKWILWQFFSSGQNHWFVHFSSSVVSTPPTLCTPGWCTCWGPWGSGSRSRWSGPGYAGPSNTNTNIASIFDRNIMWSVLSCVQNYHVFSLKGEKYTFPESCLFLITKRIFQKSLT